MGVVYTVRNTIGVSRKDVGQASTLVQTAIEAGANDVMGPQFSVANEKDVQDECMARAFRDAKQKAVNLARLAERRLGGVLAVTDGSSSPFELKYRAGVEPGVPGGILFEPGVHNVECGVTIAFRLE